MEHSNTPEQDRWANAVWFTAQMRMAIQGMCDQLAALPPIERGKAMMQLILHLESKGQEHNVAFAKMLRQYWGLENV